MTRLRLPFGRRVLVLLAVLVALVVLFPLRLGVAMLGLDGQGVTARAVSGSVWAGRIEELTVSGVPLGSVRAGLSPLHLLLGEARIAVARGADDAAQGALGGTVTVSRNSLGVRDLTASLPLAAALAPLPIGTVGVTGLTVRFEGGSCARAVGSVRAALSGSIGGIALAQGLTGQATCEGRYLRLPLASQSGQERLDVRVTETGDYTADLIAAAPGADRVPILTGLGFQPVPGGYRLRATGRFR